MNTSLIQYTLESQFPAAFFTIKEKGDSFSIVLKENSKLNWKSKAFTWESMQLSEDFQASKDSLSFKSADFPKLIEEVKEISSKIKKENFHSFYQKIHNSESSLHWGFEDKNLKESHALLEELYRDEFIVAEKKPFVFDPQQSHGATLVSTDENKHCFIDAAAQIASLNLGINEKPKAFLKTRNFLKNKKLQEDIQHAYESLLKKESGHSHVYWSSSGASSMELAIQILKNKFPKRKKILAFEGSFHGRSLLTLHLSYNPVKRLPFQIYEDLCHYVALPASESGETQFEDPKDWTEFWGGSLKNQPEWDESNTLLQSEIKVLKEIQESFQKEDYLCLAIEPLLCEGGDKYFSTRFARALRLLCTRFETPLAFDEVQSGFSLGNSFFWHQEFSPGSNGKKCVQPDLICVAKKAQLGAVICSLDVPELRKAPANMASLYRGYLQARTASQIDDFDDAFVFEECKKLQKFIGSETISNPRGQKLCFAFDLPSKEILMALVASRFNNGLLFYPAGEKTARFRLLKSASKKDLSLIFTSVYKCFLECSEKKIIEKEFPPLDEWIHDHEKNIQKHIHDFLSSKLQIKNIKKISEFPFENYKIATQEEWRNLFHFFVSEFPEVLTLKSNEKYSLSSLEKMNLEKLAAQYEEDQSMQSLDFLWHASRLLSHELEIFDNTNDVEAITEEISSIEEDVYEEERRDPPENFIKAAASAKGFVIVSRNSEKKILGITALDSIQNHAHKKLIKDDPLKEDSSCYYSVDVTVRSESRGQYLGLRLKVEQVLEAKHRGVEKIRSRNRWPEAQKMANLNLALGSLIIDEMDNVYNGEGKALYQSLSLEHFSEETEFFLANEGSLLNKVSLTNFCNPQFIRGMLCVKKLLPENLKHCFCASSEAEALDKSIKLLIAMQEHKKGAHQVLSFKEDNFCKAHASGASLGNTKNSYFEWPKFTLQNWKEEFSAIEHKKTLGLVVSSELGDSALLQEISDFCKTKSIPLILNESASALPKDSTLFELGSRINADISYKFLGNQMALLACNDQFFLKKPLMMISTWDGDEFGLHNFLSETTLEACRATL